MQKARSRLSPKSNKSKKSKGLCSKFGLKLKLPKFKKNKLNLTSNLLGKYIKHWPTLLVGLVFSFTTFLILTKIHPSQIKHFILPHTYLPLLISAFLMILFLTGFIALKTRTGLFAATTLTFILFLKLQNVILEQWWLAGILGGDILLELAIRAIKALKNKSEGLKN